MWKKIDKIAKRHNLKVIYDAAHAFGETYNNIGVGTFGDASMFSFHATKVYNTIEGGAICHNSALLEQRMYNLKNFGIEDEEHVIYVGANAKMNEFCASMGICNLRHVDEEISKRKKVTQRYIENLSNVQGIKLNKFQNDVKYNYAYFPILIIENEFGVNRDIIFADLKAQNIYTRKYFYPCVNAYDCYKDKYNVSDTPIANVISKRVLTLPMYADLSIDTVDMICNTILSLKRR